MTDGYTALFSGGLDSLSGTLNAQKKFGKVDCALSRHADQYEQRAVGSFESILPLFFVISSIKCVAKTGL